MLIVLGSINIDLTSVAAEIPKVGETVIGESFAQYPGGKGANQAVCAAKLRAGVCFMGKVGSDAYGDFMLREMASGGVDVSRVERCGASTGLASISVDKLGQNSIIVIPGANFEVDCEYVERHKVAIEQCDLLLAQHETPKAATEYAFTIAKACKKTTILNPAPADEISGTMMSLTDILVPNEHELARLSGHDCDSMEARTSAARSLRNRGVQTVIVTMGAAGVLLVTEGDERVFPAYKTQAVDTTAAGDCFLGGFAASYIHKRDMADAIAYGQMAASYSIRHRGAQSSMPSYEQLQAYVDELTS